MKRCLVDVNVMLALVANQHKHHQTAVRRFDQADAGEWGLCRVVQLGFVRLLGHRSIMTESALPASEGWRVSQELLKDERFSRVVEPNGLDELIAPLLKYNVPTPRLVTDAYLAGLSIGVGRTLLTLDQGFAQFEGIDLEVLK